MPKVCIDPGHGGYDPGACGNGLKESNITLEIALQLRSLLIPNGIEVILTRDGNYSPGNLKGDVNRELRARVDIAEKAKVDIFVSIHINAFNGSASGEEVLIAGLGGKAETAANKVLNQINKVTGWGNRGIKVQNVYVLKWTSMPAILTENGFIDSVSDSVKLKDPDFIHSLAVAHAKGICDYFGVTYADSGYVTILQASDHGSAPSLAPVSVPSLATLKYTYPNNAKVIGDDLYIRDANGNKIPGRYVSKGDSITVLDVSGSRQLCLVEYPTPIGVKSGYVANVVSCIQYIYQDQWQNGSTNEAVLDENGASLGSLNPRESATPLYRKNGKLHVVYDTIKGANTKSGYVAWNGGFNKF